MSRELLLLAPLLAPLSAAALGLLLYRRRRMQLIAAAMALLAAVAAGVALVRETVASGVIAVSIGGEQLVGVALTAEPFGAALVVATGLLAALVVAAMARTDPSHPYSVPLILVVVGAASGSFVTGDLFNLFVLIEVAVTASYALLVLEHGGRRGLRAVTVYLVVNIAGTIVLLAGIAAVYGAAGTVDLASLAALSLEGSAALPGAALVVVALSLKAGLVPFTAWVAVGYPAARRPLMALLAGTLTTIGIAGLYRVGLLAFGAAPGLRVAVLAASVATLLVAPLAALATRRRRRVLALLVAAQVGFMGIGFGLGTRAAIAAGVFFALQDIAVKSALILTYVPGERDGPAVSPLLLAAFAVLGLSLAGMPPLAGFAGKALLVESALAAGAPVVAAALLVSSALILASLLPLYWRMADRTSSGRSITAVLGAAVAVAVAAVGIAPGGLLAIAGAAADTLLDPAGYAEAVLGR